MHEAEREKERQTDRDVSIMKSGQLVGKKDAMTEEEEKEEEEEEEEEEVPKMMFGPSPLVCVCVRLMCQQVRGGGGGGWRMDRSYDWRGMNGGKEEFEWLVVVAVIAMRASIINNPPSIGRRLEGKGKERKRWIWCFWHHLLALSGRSSILPLRNIPDGFIFFWGGGEPISPPPLPPPPHLAPKERERETLEEEDW